MLCDIITLEKAYKTKTLASINEINPNGLLLVIKFYYDGVTIGMNGKTFVTLGMYTLGRHSQKLFKQCWIFHIKF